MSKKTNGEIQKPPEHIEQIRDIIFGSQKREYDKLFRKIDADLSTLHEELRKRIEEMTKTFSSKLGAAVQSLEKKINLVGITSQEDAKYIKEQIELKDKKFANSLSTAAQETADSVSALHAELTETRGKFQEEVRNLKEQMLRELETQVEILQSNKVSKEIMAETLFELGTKIKDVEMGSGVQKAIRTRVKD